MTMKKQEGHLLDLDAILASHVDSSSGSDDDDVKGSFAPRRTVDEILNDSSSDDDTSTLAHTVIYSSSTTVHSSNDGDDDNENQIENIRENNKYNNSGNQSRFRVGTSSSLAEPKLVVGVESSSSAAGGERIRSSLYTRVLFGGVGVRSAKPGAALAAATAASRPIQSRTRRAAPLIPFSPPSLSTPTSSSTTGSIDLQGEGLEPELQLDKSSSSELEVVPKLGESSYDHFDEMVVSVASGSSEVKIVNEQHDDNDIQWETSKNSSFNDDFAPLEKEPEEATNISDISHESQSTSFVEPVTNSPLSPETNMLDESTDTKTQSPSTEETDDALNADKVKDENNVMRMTDSQISELGDDAEPFFNTTTDEETVARSDFLELPKRPKKKINPLELAEEVEKKHAFSGLDLENDIASQPMRLEGVRRASIALGYFDVNSKNNITRTISSQLFRRDQGSPQSVAVHFNYVAVGLSKGLVLVVPSKYSPHSADNLDAKMMMLGLQGDNSHPAVTSMCFNQLGDILFAGYSDGRITVWDLQKGSPLKVITGIHNAPVVHLLYLGQDSQVTRQYRVVSGDSKGLVWLITFSVVPWVNRISYSTTCLLDGQTTGKALCASPLLPDEFCGGSLMSSQNNGGSSTSSSSSISSMMGGVLGGGDSSKKLSNDKSSTVEDGVVIFATYQSALVARVSPSVVVYAQLSRPDGVREGSMPYTAWKSMGKLNGSSTDIPVEASEKVSLLAIAWDRKVQVAKLVKSELKIFAKWTLESSAIGVAWMDDEMLVVLTSNGQLCLFAKDGTMIHQTSFIIDGYGGDDLVSYHMHFTNIYGNPEKAYHNCIAVRGATIYILGPYHLIICRLLPWKERVQVLRKACDWMGALNMAMSLFDGQAHGVIDLPRKIDDVQEAIMPYLVELLLSYVDEVFSYISVAFCNQIGKLEQLSDSESKANSVHLEIKEQFSRVGGVAVEFCVHIKRTDVLFDEILSKFVAVQQRDTFLELLEPYILKDMLGSLPPEVMQALVEHYSTKGWLQRVEQCVLHMDISSLDFNQVVRLCREHRLYGALVYLFNRGLDDFKAPLEELLIVLNDSEREAAVALGYRMLVYLKYCFTGLAFPPGQGSIPATRLTSLRTELVQFLLEPSNAIKTSCLVNKETAFVNVYHLLELDTEATLDVLKCAFVENEATNDDNLEMENDLMGADQNLMVQKVVNSLVHVLDQTETSTEIIEIWPSKCDVGRMLEFISYYIACKRAVVSNGVLSQILEYYATDINLPVSSSGEKVDLLRKREKQMLALLEAVPQTDWETDYALQLFVKAQFFQVCGLIHTIHHRHIQALDSYMKDLHEPLHAFCFVTDTLDKLSGNEAELFRSAVISRIPDLIILSREDAFFLVMHHFNGECQNILSELRSHPKSLFLYLKTVFEVQLSGTLAFRRLPKDENLNLISGKAKHSVEVYLKRISGFSKYLRENPVQVTDEMIELYLQLLCQYDRNSVLNFLETFENYRVENCLRLCQEYGIIDASAFLLERVGDVGSALLLTLSGLDDKFNILDNAVEQVISDNPVKHYNAALKAEVNNIRDILVACVGLCQRNTLRLDIDESESLWFQLLDSFVEPLVGSFRGELNAKRDSHNGSLLGSIDAHKDKEAPIIKWKISKDQKNAKILRKLFSQFIREIVEGMIGFVRLPVIMTKLLADNSGQEFGDFKLTILEMLGTYGFERQILDTAKSLIEDDTFYTMSLLKKGASRGYAPKKLICCICNCLIVRDSSSSSGIHIFSCGHVSHLKCDAENEMSHKGLGCPVCMPTKKGLKSKGKTAIKENGLVVNPNSKRPQQAHGIVSPYAHESDAAENSYGFPQISRFDMLTSLKKEQRLIQVETIPQLRLAPPAVYHEKVKKRIHLDLGESSNRVAETEKPSKTKQLRDIKLRGSSIRLPLKASIFGKEKSRRR